MAVPFFVPSNGGNGPSSSDTSTTSESGATAVANPGVAAPTLQIAQIPQDPLTGALCEALYRVLLARQGQVGGSILPPPSPTCSPYQFSSQPMTDVFFPNGATWSPPQSPSDHNTTLNLRLNEPLTPRTAHEFVFGNARRIEQALRGRQHDHDAAEASGSDGQIELREFTEELTEFNGTVPLQRRRKVNNKVDERGKEVLTWPVVTAVLVAVGCGILRATR